MPQADANAFKVLKRNHALLNRRSRNAFDIHTHNKKVKVALPKVRVAPLKSGQQKAIRKKIYSYRRQSSWLIVVRTALTLIISIALIFWLFL